MAYDVRAGKSSSLAGVEAIVFDAYGTLFDTQSVLPALEREFPGRGVSLTQLWRLKQLEYSWLRTVADAYEDFGVVTRDALRHSLAALGLPSDGELVARLAQTYDRLELYAETVRGLDALAPRRLAVFSNGSPAMLAALFNHAGIGDRFEQMISVDSARAFKPSPKAYGVATSALQLAPHQVLLVSSNGFDIMGGARFGLRTARVERVPATRSTQMLSDQAVEPSTALFHALRSHPEAFGAAPDVTVGSIEELAGLLI